MTYKGIRIRDAEGSGLLSARLCDILNEVPDADQLEWSILYLYATGHLGDDQSMPNFEQKIRDAERGFFIRWEDLCGLAKKFCDLIDIVLISCKDGNMLKRHETNQEMHQACDIVIELIDSSYWEVFSKNENLINRLAKKFHQIELLRPDS